MFCLKNEQRAVVERTNNDYTSTEQFQPMHFEWNLRQTPAPSSSKQGGSGEKWNIGHHFKHMQHSYIFTGPCFQNAILPTYKITLSFS